MLKNIPDELLRELLQHRVSLERGGKMVRGQGQRVRRYRLRFTVRGPGGRRQRTIPFNPDFAPLVAMVVNMWRREFQERKAAEKQKEQLDREQKQKVQAMRQQAIRLGGGGRRRRQRIGKEFDQAAEGPRAMYAYQITQTYLRPDRRPGRPRKGALTLPTEAGDLQTAHN
jgi:hypothetical protein